MGGAPWPRGTCPRACRATLLKRGGRCSTATDPGRSPPASSAPPSRSWWRPAPLPPPSARPSLPTGARIEPRVLPCRNSIDCGLVATRVHQPDRNGAGRADTPINPYGINAKNTGQNTGQTESISPWHESPYLPQPPSHPSMWNFGLPSHPSVCRISAPLPSYRVQTFRSLAEARSACRIFRRGSTSRRRTTSPSRAAGPCATRRGSWVWISSSSPCASRRAHKRPACSRRSTESLSSSAPPLILIRDARADPPLHPGPADQRGSAQAQVRHPLSLSLSQPPLPTTNRRPPTTFAPFFSTASAATHHDARASSTVSPLSP